MRQAASPWSGWGKGPTLFYFAFLLLSVVGIVAIAIKVAGEKSARMRTSEGEPAKDWRKFMRAWADFSLSSRGQFGDNKREGYFPSGTASAQTSRTALSHYYRLMVGIMVRITHAFDLPRNTMAKVSRKGARAWRHHGKFIFVLMLLTAPSPSTATRLYERGGGAGRPIVIDNDYLDGSNYIINAKSAIEYGNQFTNALMQHLEVHGVDEKYESREWIIGQVEKVLDEMRSETKIRDDAEGLQVEQDRAQAEQKALDSLKAGSDDVPENHLDGNWQDSEEGAHGGEQGGRGDLPFSTGLSQGPTVDPDYVRAITNAPNSNFGICSRVQSLFDGLANATNLGIKEGAELMAQVESYVEESTPCQTPTSSCLAKAL